MSKVWIDGKPVDGSQARVPVFDRGFLYGDSVYEVLRTFEGRPFALGEHLERLEGSAQRIGMTLPARATIQKAVEDTLKALGDANAYVRIVITRGAGEIALDPAMADAPRLIVIVKPVKLPEPMLYANGVEVAIVDRPRYVQGGPSTGDPQVKSGNYLGSVLAVAEARKRGAYEAILSDSMGRISEGSSSNFFIARGGRIVTPPLSVGLLEGITRRKVMEVARADGIAVDEQPLWPIDLQRAEEAFITSSVRGVLPVVKVDGQPIGAGVPGSLTRRVIALYDRLTRQKG